jgi:putative SOS response-associated peptidase YedK
MCGRYRLSRRKQIVEEHFRQWSERNAQSYNLARRTR